MCLAEKEADQFSPDRRAKDGCQARCKKCKSGETRAAYAANPSRKSAIGKRHYRSDRGATSRLSRMFGITVEGYRALLEKQGGRCAICPATEPGRGNVNFCVDHDHKTGAVRGLLCSRCNVALGLMNDDMAQLKSALEYMQSPPAQGVINAA
jgi:hypothetical protein